MHDELLREAREALAQEDLLAEMGVPVNWGEVRNLNALIRRLIAALESGDL